MVDSEDKHYLRMSYEILQDFIKKKGKDKLNRKELMIFFGPGDDCHDKRNFINAKALYIYLSRMSTDIVFRNSKMRNYLSYLICI